KITGGASGALRQEFCELEILDSITKSHCEGILPAHFGMADRRNSLISLFRKAKGKNYMPPTLHDALQWRTGDPFLDWPHSNMEWGLVGKDQKQTAPNNATTGVQTAPKKVVLSTESRKQPLTPTPSIEQPPEKAWHCNLMWYAHKKSLDARLRQPRDNEPNVWNYNKHEGICSTTSPM
ncbi:hypothetical protein L208DRAFT_1288093, partial [Tricholoma matsutake]